MYQDKIYDLEEKVYRLESNLESKEQETRDLANIASLITSILGIDQVLAVAMQTAIRQVEGEVGAIMLEEDGDFVVKISWGVDGAIINSLKYKDNLDIARYCIKNKKTIIENDGSSITNATVSISNFIATPILIEEGSSGAVVIINKESGRKFIERDSQILEMICQFTSVALENSRLLKESLDKQKMQQELELARQVQTTFLPEGISLERFDISATYIPALQISGDYYDLIPLGENRLLFLIGDVTNKGAPAALVMTSVYSIVRAYIHSGEEVNVTNLISRLNDILCNDIIKGRDMFITLFVAYIDLDSGMMEYCNGGHCPPFYYRAARKETIRLSQGGALVGQFAGMPYRATKIKINENDRIFSYTDGIIEAEDRAGRLYGLDRLEQFFKAGVMLDADRFNRVVKEEIDRFSEGVAADKWDDFTTLVIDIRDPSDLVDSIYNFQYKSSLSSLEKMYADLENIIERHKVAPDKANHLKVVISEAVTNSIIHAHNQDCGKVVKLKITINKNRILADIIDEGKPERLGDLGERDLNIDPSAEGGRGLGIIKKLSDDFRIKSLPEGGTMLRIEMKLKTNRFSSGG